MAEKGTQKYSDLLFINPDNITYGYASFKGFGVEAVYIKGNLKGEFHIKPSGNVVVEKLLSIIQQHIGIDAECNLVDRSGVLNLDYPIYVIIKNLMLIDDNDEMWKVIEQTLNEGV